MMGRLFARQAKERERRDELLSAYLDGELNAGEQARLEVQLATDPALQAELKALRQTVALMRDLPQIPIPRNFILPQTAAARPRPASPARPRRAWAAPLLTAATAVASLLFVIVLAGDLLLAGQGNLVMAPEAAPREAPQVALEASPVVREAEEVVFEEEEPAPAAEAPVEAPSEAAEAAPSATLPQPQATVLAANGERDEGKATPRPLVVEDVVATPTAPTTAKAAEPTPAEAGWAAPPTIAEEPGEVRGDEGVPASEETSIVQTTPRRLLEVALGLIALGLALATVRAWRIHRR